MRTLGFTLLAGFSVCNTPSSTGDGPPGDGQSSEGSVIATAPKQQRTLEVSRRPARKGEPIALRGREKLLCAQRKDAPTACVGELGLALEAVDPAMDDGRYSRTHAEKPVALQGLDLSRLEANGYTRCFQETGGALQCWRRDVGKRAGRHPEPLPFSNLRDFAVENQTCGIDGAGQLRCTGEKTCTNPKAGDQYDPAQVVAIPGIDTALVVSKALRMGCAVLQDRTVSCWGEVRRRGCSEAALPVPELSDVIDIAVGDFWACALRADNRVLCWGLNAGRALGPAEPRYSWTPLEVAKAFPAIQVTAGHKCTVALRTDGGVVTWGKGILGLDAPQPTELKFSHPAIDVVPMDGFACALLDTGAVECAGIDVDEAVAGGQPRPPFEGIEPWVNAPLYRLAPRPAAE